MSIVLGRFQGRFQGFEIISVSINSYFYYLYYREVVLEGSPGFIYISIVVRSTTLVFL